MVCNVLNAVIMRKISLKDQFSMNISVLDRGFSSALPRNVGYFAWHSMTAEFNIIIKIV